MRKADAPGRFVTKPKPSATLGGIAAEKAMRSYSAFPPAIDQLAVSHDANTFDVSRSASRVLSIGDEARLNPGILQRTRLPLDRKQLCRSALLDAELLRRFGSQFMSLSKPALLFALIALLLVARCFALIFPFWGLEYEDAYIYTDTANFMRFDYPWDIDPWKTKSVISGSLEAPEFSGTYGGHPEAFSLVIYAVARVFGWRSDIGLLVNSATSLIVVVAAVAVWRFRRSYSSLVALAMLCGAPMLSVMHSSGFSEVFSSIFVGAFIFAAYRAFLSAEGTRIDTLVTVVTFAAAVLIKRENLALAAAFAVAVLLRPEALKQRGFWCAAIMSGALFAGYAYGFRILDIERNEGEAIGQATFTLANFRDNFPQLAEALFRPDYFGVITALAVASGFGARKRPVARGYLFFAAMALLYVLMYSAHYRSFRQSGWGEVSAFEMARYCTNLVPCLLAMVLVVPRSLAIAWSRRGRFLLLALAVAGVCSALSQLQRLSLTEQAERFAPLRVAGTLVKPGEPILCENPMVGRLILPTDQHLVDISVLRDSELLRHSAQFLVVLKGRLQVRRDLRDTEFIKNWGRECLHSGAGFEVWRFTKRE